MKTKDNGNTISFAGDSIYVGIDVHLKQWKVTILSDRLFHKTYSMNPNPKELHRYLLKNFPGGTYYSVYEAGFCGFWIHDQFTELGISNIVVNPADVPTTDKDKKQKADKRDSLKLAKALRAQQLLPIRIPSKVNRSDRGLIRTRKALVKDLNRIKNRIKSQLYFNGIEYPEHFKEASSHWTRRFLEWLKAITFENESNSYSFNFRISQYLYLRKQLLAITREIRELTRNETYSQDYNNLVSIPGVGLITSMTFLTEIESISKYKNLEHLCSYIGFVPTTHSSGESIRVGKITPRGKNYLRNMIIESAWVAARVDPVLTMTYHKLCKRMKPNNAIIRIAKKLLNRMRFVLINKKNYEINIVA